MPVLAGAIYWNATGDWQRTGTVAAHATAPDRSVQNQCWCDPMVCRQAQLHTANLFRTLGIAVMSR